MKNFGLIGAAGYIAPRHMQAIKETGNVLLAALDKSDSVGVIDSYFPAAMFFIEFERFDRYVELLRRNEMALDYISIASPNYLHDAHMRFALRHQAHVICEKPLVLNPHNLEALRTVEDETDKSVNCILQLRLHPTIIDLRDRVLKSLMEDPDTCFDVDLTYITSRGSWYFVSWKGDEDKSGGIATNIGVHFFDMLGWIFGEVKNSEVHFKSDECNAGYLEFNNARVRWFLAVDEQFLPSEAASKGARTYRSITVDGEELEFSDGFTDLHTKSYERILSGQGFGLSDAKQSVEVVSEIRESKEMRSSSLEHDLVMRARHL